MIIPNWIIFGGESGANRRPCSEQWARDLRDECLNSGTNIKFFMKQMSGLTPAKAKEAIPADLMIQEFPA